MKIETLRWSLPLIIGAVVPAFFLFVYLGSCSSRLRRLRQICHATYQDLEAALRLRLQAATRLARWLRERSPLTAARCDEYLAAATALERLLANPASRWPGQVEEVRQASAFLDQDLAGAEPSQFSGEPADEWRATLKAFAQAIAAYNQACEKYTNARTRFPSNMLAALARDERVPRWRAVEG